MSATLKLISTKQGWEEGRDIGRGKSGGMGMRKGNQGKGKGNVRQRGNCCGWNMKQWGEGGGEETGSEERREDRRGEGKHTG